MNRCGSCGAAMSAGAQWCGQCFALPTPAAVGFRPLTAAGPATPAPAMRTTRWGKTQTTFGPVGRVIATIATLLPLAVMVAGGFVDMFAWGGALVYLVAIVPQAMRHTWQAGRLPVR